MPYLYLTRSFLRRPKRHISLLLILTCALVLPLLISVYRDSLSYGTALRLLSETKGETFHILNASESDLPLFENIPGLSAPRYDGGTVYLHILSENEWKDQTALDRYGSQILGIINRAGEGRLSAVAYSYKYAKGIGDDSSSSEKNALLILNLFIILLSAFTVGSAYRTHLKRFYPDIFTLRSLGAEDFQIYLIFISEFLAAFIISSLAAAAISAGVMKLLLATYLGVEGVEGLEWVVFRMDPLNTLLHIFFFFAALSGIIFKSLADALSGSVISSREEILENRKSAPAKIMPGRKPAKALAEIWLTRTNGAYASCLKTAVPVIALFLFLFGYLSLGADFLSEKPEFEILISKDASAYGGFTEDDIGYINSLSQIKAAELQRQIPEELFRPIPGGTMTDRIKIKLSDPVLHSETAELLKSRFTGAGYSVRDLQETAEQGAKTSKGLYMALAFIFPTTVIFTAIIVIMKLRDYIRDSGKTLRTLSALGAEDRALIASYVIQAAVSASAAAAVSDILSLALLYLAAIPASVKPSLNPLFAAVYIFAGIFTAGIFILPVYKEVGNTVSKSKRSVEA